MFKLIRLIFISALLCLLMAGVLLSRLSGWGRYEKKIEGTVDEKGCYANCYTSNPKGYFPVTIQAPAKAIFPDSIVKLPDTIPMYCLPYACRQRKQGFFPERPQEVFLVGDSFTFGEGVKEEDSLGYLLGLKFPDYNFRNFGETAADLKRVYQIVQGLFEDPQPMTPKKIIYFYNLSDVNMSPEIAERQRSMSDMGNIPVVHKPQGANAFARFLSQFAWVRFLENTIVLHQEYNFLTIQIYRDIYFSPDNAKEVQQTMDDLVAMDRLVKQHGAALTVVIYPFIYKDAWGNYPFLPIHRFMMDFCDQHQVTCIDGYEAFKGFNSMKPFTVHPAQAHPNGLANRTLIDYMADQQRKELGL